MAAYLTDNSRARCGSNVSEWVLDCRHHNGSRRESRLVAERNLEIDSTWRNFWKVRPIVYKFGRCTAYCAVLGKNPNSILADLHKTEHLEADTENNNNSRRAWRWTVKLILLLVGRSPIFQDMTGLWNRLQVNLDMDFSSYAFHAAILNRLSRILECQKSCLHKDTPA
jgi:hypothetical protein